MIECPVLLHEKYDMVNVLERACRGPNREEIQQQCCLLGKRLLHSGEGVIQRSSNPCRDHIVPELRDPFKCIQGNWLLELQTMIGQSSFLQKAPALKRISTQ